MIEETILNYLNASNDLSAPVLMEIPGTTPTTFYLLEKTGSAFNNHIYSSTFVIQSYGETLYETACMNDEIKEVMLYGLLEEEQIVSVSLNTDYNYTDTQSKRYRYQAVFDIIHY